MTFSQMLVFAAPELILAIGAMGLLMFGVYGREQLAAPVASRGSVLLLIVAAMAAAIHAPAGDVDLFGGAFAVDAFAVFAKIVILAASALAILMSERFMRNENLVRFEFPILIVIATLGMMLMVSANDLISLYLGVELQSLSLYVLAAFNRDSQRSTEAGLKYFVLGALSSGLLLYGASLIYGFTGSTNFEAIATAQSQSDIGLIFGIVFLICGLAFKVSAAPFHMWTPDVYEGSPTPVTAFFSAAPKFAAMVMFIRALIGPFPELADEWRQIIMLMALLSMYVGAFSALVQTNIKRLMAYSSVSHMGYALLGLAAGTEQGVRGVLIYMTIYLAMTIGAFACILAMRRPEGMSEQISDLSGLSKNQPMLALALGLLLFSLAGVPPTAGFLAKFQVFMAAVDAGLIWLAVAGVIASVVGAVYYLRIVKMMYFDEPAEPFVRPIGATLSTTLAASVLLTFPVLVVFAAPLFSAAGHAARSLFLP